MSTITVSIGRNVGSEPMSDDEWVTFQEGTHTHADHAAWLGGGDYQIVFEGCGVGSWTGEDGITVREDAFTLVMIVDDRDARAARDDIVKRMAGLARQYGQDAIAVTLGETTLAGLR